MGPEGEEGGQRKWEGKGKEVRKGGEEEKRRKNDMEQEKLPQRLVRSRPLTPAKWSKGSLFLQAVANQLSLRRRWSSRDPKPSSLPWTRPS